MEKCGADHWIALIVQEAVIFVDLLFFIKIYGGITDYMARPVSVFINFAIFMGNLGICIAHLRFVALWQRKCLFDEWENVRALSIIYISLYGVFAFIGTAVVCISRSTSVSDGE
jgi:hypothetical protein